MKTNSKLTRGAFAISEKQITPEELIFQTSLIGIPVAKLLRKGHFSNVVKNLMAIKGQFNDTWATDCP